MKIIFNKQKVSAAVAPLMCAVSGKSTLTSIEGILIENPDGKQIAVLINPNAEGVQTQIEIGGKLWYAELQPDSISTIEIG